MDENARAELSAWVQSRPPFVQTAARIGCPACPVLSHADRNTCAGAGCVRIGHRYLSRGCALRCAWRRTLLLPQRGWWSASRGRPLPQYAARLAQFSGKAKWTTCGAVPLALRRAHRDEQKLGPALVVAHSRGPAYEALRREPDQRRSGSHPAPPADRGGGSSRRAASRLSDERDRACYEIDASSTAIRTSPRRVPQTRRVSHWEGDRIRRRNKAGAYRSYGG